MPGCASAVTSHLGASPILHPHFSTGFRVMAKGDGREVGFQDSGYFSKFLKRERINNQTFIAFLNCG